MDPDANLREQREIAKTINRIQDQIAPDGHLTAAQTLQLAAYGQRLAELSQALDEWISKGGFLPAAWIISPSRARKLCAGCGASEPLYGPGLCGTCYENQENNKS